MVGLAATGCMRSGIDADALRPDSTLVTGSIPEAPKITGPQTDDDALKEALATATPATAVHGIPWANEATGTVGVISYVEDVDDATRSCRRFETSRHSYDGIALFVGEACRDPGKPWQIIGFSQKGPQSAGQSQSKDG